MFSYCTILLRRKPLEDGLSIAVAAGERRVTLEVLMSRLRRGSRSATRSERQTLEVLS